MIMQVSATKYYNGTTNTVDYLATVQPDGYLYFNDETFYRCREDGTQLQQCYMSKDQWVRCGVLSNISISQFTTGVPGGSAMAIIALAESQLGNTGAFYWNWAASEGIVTGPFINDAVTPWCACIVSWLLNQVGATAYSFPRANAFDYGDVPSSILIPPAQIIAGDIVSFDWDNDNSGDHVGLCVANDGTNITSIDGNTNGGKVDKRVRSLGVVIAGIRPNYA